MALILYDLEIKKIVIFGMNDGLIVVMEAAINMAETKNGGKGDIVCCDGGESQKLFQAWFCFDNNRNKWFSIQLEIERTFR